MKQKSLLHIRNYTGTDRNACSSQPILYSMQNAYFWNISIETIHFIKLSDRIKTRVQPHEYEIE